MGSKNAVRGINEERNLPPIATAATAVSSASGVQATVTVAAGTTGVRHIVDSFCFGIAGNVEAGIVATTVLATIIDGASGGTDYLFQKVLHVGSAGVNPVAQNSVNLAGTAATALTIEFSAGVGLALESVNMGYYDVGQAGT